MSLIINKISSSSLQVNYSYLESDLLFGYETVANYTIEFADVSYTNEQNVLFEGIEALRQAYQQKNLVARIGGDEFINGRITSQSFEESALVGNSKCTITIEESKRLDDYSSHTFAQHIPSPQWIDSFSENFSFSRNADSYSSSRNVTLKYKQDAGSQFLNNAKLFLRNIYFDARPNLGYHVDGISENGRFDGGFRPLITESIDLLGLSVSLQENLETSFIDGDHSKRQSYSIEVDAGGYTQKKYSINIKAIKEPLETVADEACKDIIDALAAENLAAFGKPIEIGKGINKDGGSINLSISFTNNPSLNSANTFIYSVEKSRNQAFWDYALKAEIFSEGKNPLDKSQKTNTYWLSVLSTYVSKVQSLFPEATTIYEKSRSTSFQTNENAKIIDNVVYTTDSSYDSALLSSGILKFTSTTSTSEPIERMRPVVDIVTKNELLERTNGLTSIGGGSLSLEAITLKSRGIFHARNYLKGIDYSAPNTYITSKTNSINHDGTATRVISYDTTA